MQRDQEELFREYIREVEKIEKEQKRQERKDRMEACQSALVIKVKCWHAAVRVAPGLLHAPHMPCIVPAMSRIDGSSSAAAAVAAAAAAGALLCA